MLGLKAQPDVVAIYIGDDRTDEDAFKVLQEGHIGEVMHSRCCSTLQVMVWCL